MTDKLMPGTIPFGKYKGKPIEALRADPSYVQWLTAQDWVRQRFPNLLQVIVNNFGEPSETPEHNRLQTRFLDNEFGIAALVLCGLWWIETPRGLLVNRANRIREGLKWARGWELRSQEKELVDAEKYLAEFDANPPQKPYPISVTQKFEVRGWDVQLEATLDLRTSGIIEQGIVFIEIKPALGDDYPAVLRQMKANYIDWLPDNRPHYALVLEQFTGSGATLDQVRAIFKTAGFPIVTVAEIEKRQNSR